MPHFLGLWPIFVLSTKIPSSKNFDFFFPTDIFGKHFFVEKFFEKKMKKFFHKSFSLQVFFFPKNNFQAKNGISDFLLFEDKIGTQSVRHQGKTKENYHFDNVFRSLCHSLKNA